METTEDMKRKRRKSLWPLALLICLFALPPLIGWLYFLNPDLLPSGRKNQGELIQPSVELSTLALQTQSGTPFNIAQLEGRWTLTVVAASKCSESCARLFDTIAQLRRAQKAGQQRMNLLLILLEDTNGAEIELPIQEPGVLLAIADESSRLELQELFSFGSTEPDTHFFTLDPRGHLMMKHDTTSLTPKQVLADFKTLLAATEPWESPRSE